MIITIVIGALGTVTNDLVQGQENLEIRGLLNNNKQHSPLQAKSNMAASLEKLASQSSPFFIEECMSSR